MDSKKDHPYESTEYIVFDLESEFYCVEIQKIERIIEFPKKMRFVPKLPNYIRGIIDFEEKIVPVVDLKNKFNPQKTTTNSPEQFIVLFELKSHLIGIIVDTIFESKEVNGGIRQEPSLIPFNIREYSDGTIRMEDEQFQKNGKSTEELVVILSPLKIYNSIEKELNLNGN